MIALKKIIKIEKNRYSLFESDFINNWRSSLKKKVFNLKTWSCINLPNHTIVIILNVKSAHYNDKLSLKIDCNKAKKEKKMTKTGFEPETISLKTMMFSLSHRDLSQILFQVYKINLNPFLLIYLSIK